MKLLFILNWYTPDSLVPARRWGNLVAHLIESGVECVVVSAGDGTYQRCNGFAGETVIRLPIRNHDGSSSAISDAESSDNKIKINRFKKYAINVLPSILSQILSAPKLWRAACRNKEIIEVAKSSDLIISSYGPVGPLLLGRGLAKVSNKPWIIDIRDSFESKRGHQSALLNYVSKGIERYLLGEALHRITIGETLANLLSSQYKMPFHPIYNGWVDSDVMQASRDGMEPMPYLYYAGSIYSHRLAALSIGLMGVKKFPEIRIKIRLLKSKDLSGVQEIVNKTDTVSQVEILPAASQEVVHKETAAALGVLVLEEISDDYVINSGTVTGKLFGLLASGVPGIAISSAKGEIRRIVNEVPGWYGVDNVNAFREALDDLMARQSSLCVGEFINEFHVSKQAQKLVELLR